MVAKLGRSAVLSSALDALAPVRERWQRCRNREYRADEKRRGERLILQSEEFGNGRYLSCLCLTAHYKGSRAFPNSRLQTVIRSHRFSIPNSSAQACKDARLRHILSTRQRPGPQRFGQGPGGSVSGSPVFSPPAQCSPSALATPELVAQAQGGLNHRPGG
jgi:hypothetical protein